MVEEMNQRMQPDWFGLVIGFIELLQIRDYK
jgi:hypothetical protein